MVRLLAELLYWGWTAATVIYLPTFLYCGWYYIQDKVGEAMMSMNPDVPYVPKVAPEWTRDPSWKAFWLSPISLVKGLMK